VGPNYRRPETELPDQWRWKEASPRDEEAKGPWWELFKDAELNRLQQLALEQNQDLKAAFARVDKARAHARVTSAAFFPDINANPSWQRYRTSSTTVASFPVQSITANDFHVPIDLSYEVDLWGKVRRSFESARSEWLASTSDFENLLFSLQSDVGQNYYRLRGVDHEIEILNSAVKLRQQNLEIFEARAKAGYSSQLEVTRSQTELATAKATLADAERRRASLVNDLALLCGSTDADLEVPPLAVSLEPPEIKPGLPSQLLERRPDVAAAERRLTARNAEIGVAYAAFFPSIRLTGSGGFQSADLQDLFHWESRVWSFGPGITIPISSVGVTGARIKEARAAYDEAVAQYRQSILVAFRDVDDSLASLRFLKNQAEASTDAAGSARKSAELSIARYKNGVVDYLNVIDAERSRLDNELQLARVNTERMVQTIRLVKAIGGGWMEAKE